VNINLAKLKRRILINSILLIISSFLLASCSNGKISGGVSNHDIDKLETTEGTEYYFKIYDKEFGVKVLDNDLFKMSAPKIILEDRDDYLKGDIVFSFVDKQTGDILLDLIYTTNEHHGLSEEYSKNGKLLYSLHPQSDSVNSVIQDYVILHDEIYLTNDVFNNSLNSCALVRPMDDNHIYFEVYTQNKLELNDKVFVDLPQGELLTTISSDDMNVSNDFIMDHCNSFKENEKLVVSMRLSIYQMDQAETMIDLAKHTRVQPIGPFDKVLEGFYFDDIVVVDEYLQIVEQYSN
jgi:hypothetical protein